MADSSLTISGTLSRDPDLHFSGKATAIASLNVACNHRYMQDGEWKDGEVTWWRVTCFGKLGENVASSLRKGDRIVATGRPQANTWEKDGEKRVSIDLIADDVGGSLKWATAEFSRVTRDSANAKPAPRKQDPVYWDEEPFVDIGDRGDLTFRDMHRFV